MHYGHGVESASKRNEYRVFPGGKGGRCIRLTTLPPSCAVVMKSGNLNFLEPSGPLQACNGTGLPFFYSIRHTPQSTLRIFNNEEIFSSQPYKPNPVSNVTSRTLGTLFFRNLSAFIFFTVNSVLLSFLIRKLSCNSLYHLSSAFKNKI